MEAQMITEEIILENIVKKIWEERKDGILSFVKKKALDFRNKIEIDYGSAFIDYSERAFKKYCVIKTLILKNQPQFLEELFECGELMLGKQQVDCKDVNNILDISRYNVVVGSAGSGKTTLMKHFFLSSLDNNLYIPIFIELKDYKNSDGLFDYCYNQIHDLGFSKESEYFKYALENGMFLLLFDGFDEIYEDDGEFLKKLDKFVDLYPDNYYIISSRPCEEFIGWNRFCVFEMTALSKEKSISLIKKIDYDTTVKEKFLEELDKDLYRKHTSFASNPLLLTLMLLTYENYAEIPDKLHLFYEEVFDTLFSLHGRGFTRQLKSKLSPDIFRKVFAKFCILTYMKGTTEFSRQKILENLNVAGKNEEHFNAEDFLYDLKSSICMIVHDGSHYRFIHRSFQEYFSAVYLNDLGDDFKQKICLKIIQNRNHSFDSVFGMLRDMNRSKFEKNVIIPFIRETENKIDHANPQLSYYNYFVKYTTVYGVEKTIVQSNEDNVSQYRWTFLFSEDKVKLGIGFNNDVNFHFWYWIFLRYKTESSNRINYQEHFWSRYADVTVTKDNISMYRDLFDAIMNYTEVGFLITTIVDLPEKLVQLQQEEENEIDLLFDM